MANFERFIYSNRTLALDMGIVHIYPISNQHLFVVMA
jgi:hypothetical protein